MGRLGGVPGPPGAGLGASWGLPGASWGVLGASVGRPRSYFKSILEAPLPTSFSEPFRKPFSSNFRPFWELSWEQKSTKNVGGLCKIKVFRVSLPNQFLDRFGVHFGANFHPQIPPKSTPEGVLGRLGGILGRLGSLLERSWAVLGLPRGSRISFWSWVFAA